MSLSDRAISSIKGLIQSGRLPPGSKLPPEAQLAAQLGLSRNLTREAVKALVVARVLEIRRGDGTYVTSLAPGVLFESLASAVELLRPDTLMELVEVRRVFEPSATGLAATRVDSGQLAEIAAHLEAMRAARDDVEALNKHDAAFHHAVIAAAGNETRTTLMDGISVHTLRVRVWRGMVDHDVAETTLAEHTTIYNALSAGNATLAQAAALVHLNTTEQWLREHFDDLVKSGPEALGQAAGELGA